MISKVTRSTAVAFGVALISFSVPALARPDLNVPSTPFQSDTLVDDGTSILNNPANAAFQPGIEAGLGLRLVNGNNFAEGYYGYGSWTARFGFNVSGALAVRTGFDRGLTGVTSIAWGKGPIAVGLRYRVYSAAEESGWNGVGTSDLGLTLRPLSALSLSFVLENLWDPGLDSGVNIGRGYRIGIGTRTLKGRFMAGLSAGFHPWPGDKQSDVGIDFMSNVNDRVTLYTTLRAHSIAGVFSDSLTLRAGLSIRAQHVTVDAALHRSATGWDYAAGWGGAGLIRFNSQPKGEILTGEGLLLRVELSGSIPERPARGILSEGRAAFVDQLLELRKVRDDDRFAGVYLHLSATELGVAQLWELRQALDEIRERDKRIVVYIEQGGIRDLYLAAAGDFVMISPSFTANDSGLRVERLYIADLLERVGIRAQFLRVGEYKSAVEMFTRGEPSPEADEALHAYLRTVWTELSTGICRGRPSSACPGGSFPFHRPIHADSLLESGWAQLAGYEDELKNAIRSRFGRNFQPVTWSQAQGPADEWRSRPHIGVIHVSGMILDGGSGSNPLTGDSFTGAGGLEKAIRTAMADSNLAGVILRVSSPGGSAFASDEMLRAIQLLANTGIPVRVSMGNEAASGGYYVTAFETKIFAAPTTLTGSIGIYAGTFAIDELLSSIGVNRDATLAGGPARLFNGRTWGDEDIAFMQAGLDFGYRRFVQLVADARGFTFEEADKVARGRIWSGSDAKSVGLVDATGSFLDAYDDLCAEISACRRQPLTLKHYTEDRMLPIPTPFALAMERHGLEATVGNLRSIAQNLGAISTVARILSFAGSRPNELRYDLGGDVQIRFQ